MSTYWKDLSEYGWHEQCKAALQSVGKGQLLHAWPSRGRQRPAPRTTRQGTEDETCVCVEKRGGERNSLSAHDQVGEIFNRNKGHKEKQSWKMLTNDYTTV